MCRICSGSFLLKSRLALLQQTHLRVSRLDLLLLQHHCSTTSTPGACPQTNYLLQLFDLRQELTCKRSCAAKCSSLALLQALTRSSVPSDLLFSLQHMCIIHRCPPKTCKMFPVSAALALIAVPDSLSTKTITKGENLQCNQHCGPHPLIG